MKLSIVIPVYNSEQFLERCLKSIFTAVALAPRVTAEVFLINNNSTDRSLAVAKAFAKNSPLKLHILDCKTKGAAAVRNFGAARASGDYLWFIDSDDEIDKDSIKLLLGAAQKTRADLIMLSAQRIYPDGHSDTLMALDPAAADFKSKFVRYGAGPWQFIFSKKWWTTHQFKFKEGIIHEDMEMISSLILYTDRFAAVNQPLYYYYQNPGSVLHQTTWDPHALDIFPALTGLYTRFESAHAATQYQAELEWFFIWNLLIDSAKDFTKSKEGRPAFRRSRQLLKTYFPNWRQNRFLKEKPLKLRLYVRLSYYGLVLGKN